MKQTFSLTDGMGIWLFVFLQFFYPPSNSINTEFSSFSELYFKKLTHMRGYEFSIPLVYHFDISENDVLFDRVKGQWDDVDRLALMYNVSLSLNFKDNFDMIKKLKSALIDDFRPTPTKIYRKKRGTEEALNSIRDFFGDILVTCCRVLTYRDGRNFLENEESLKKGYEDLKNALVDEHKNLLQFKETFDYFKEAMKLEHQSFLINFNQIMVWIKDTEIEKNQQEVILKINHGCKIIQMYLNGIFIEVMRLSHILQSCKNHVISSAIISTGELQTEIRKLEITFAKLGYQLVLDSADIDDNFHADLLNCNIFGNTLELEIKVPVKRLDFNFDIFEVTSIPFQNLNNEICTLDIPTKILIVDEKNKFYKSLSGEKLELCNPKEHFCHVPQIRTLNKFESCAEAVFRKNSFNEIASKCKFSCFKAFENEIVSVQLAEDLFAINNHNKLLAIDTFTRGKVRLELNATKPGTLLLTAPCQYEVINVNDFGETNIVIPSGIPCIKNFTEKILFKKVLPYLWLNVSQISNESDFKIREIRNLSLKSLNTNWSQSLMTLNPLESIENFEKRFRNMEIKIPTLGSQSTFTLLNMFYFIWLSLLSLCMFAILFIFYKLRWENKGENIYDEIKNMITRKVDEQIVTKKVIEPLRKEISYETELTNAPKTTKRVILNVPTTDQDPEATSSKMRKLEIGHVPTKI